MILPLNVERPVPVVKVVAPLKVVFPLRVMAPVPVENVVAPVWEILPSAVIAPIPVRSPVVEISQSEVLTDPVSPLSPSVKVLLAMREPLEVRVPVVVVVPVTERLPPSDVAPDPRNENVGLVVALPNAICA